MSTHWLVVALEDPLLIPSSERQAAAFELLKELRPDACAYEQHVAEAPIFFCCMGNFENVFCPFCAVEITTFWIEAMDRWHAGDHRVLAVRTPCCDHDTSLNDLDYHMPQAFACFAVALERGGPDLEPCERERVEAVLNAKVRIVWQRL